MLGDFAMQAFPPVAASGGYSPVAAQELLMEAASCIAAHWLQSMRASAAAVPRLQSAASAAVALGLSGSQHVGSSHTRDRTRVSFTSRRILYH